MIILEISDIKSFMKTLLYEKENAFDAFLLSEAVIRMDSTYTIDGHINPSFYSAEEIDELERVATASNQHFDMRMVRWKTVKSHVLSIISGSKTPLFFNIVFYLSEENITKLISGSGFAGSVRPAGLMLRISYENGVLHAITGSVYNDFTLDKSIDEKWDEMICKFFNSHSIAFEQK